MRSLVIRRLRVLALFEFHIHGLDEIDRSSFVLQSLGPVLHLASRLENLSDNLVANALVLVGRRLLATAALNQVSWSFSQNFLR